MKLFSVSKDGGPDSNVTGFFLIECKPLFSIVLLKFAKGSREAFHNHAFNALTLWLRGTVREHTLVGTSRVWKAGQRKYTRRSDFHKVEALTDAWALSFRGPWIDRWREYVGGCFVTLTHGRKVLSKEDV